MNHFNHDLHLVSCKIILYVISINGYVCLYIIYIYIYYIKPLKKTSFEYATGSMFCASQAIMMEAKKLIK